MVIVMLTTATEALPAYSGRYLKPFQRAALWLAVMTTAPPAFLVRMA